MYFKNLQFFRLSPEWTTSAEQLNEQLASHSFQPCGEQDSEMHGFVAPVDGGDLVHALGDTWYVCLQTEAKVLPDAVVKQRTGELAQAIEQEQGFKPGRKQMSDLKEQARMQLLPEAFTRQTRMYAWLDRAAGWMAIDASSTPRAETLLEVLRKSTSTLPLTLPRTQMSPLAAMTAWLYDGDGPAGFSLDGDCTLKGMDEGARTVTYRNGLEDEQIVEHLDSGKRPTALSMTYDDRVSFELNDKGVVKKLRMLDVVEEDLASIDENDAYALLNGQLALNCAEQIRLLDALMAALGGLEGQGEHDLVEQVRTPEHA